MSRPVLAGAGCVRKVLSSFSRPGFRSTKEECFRGGDFLRKAPERPMRPRELREGGSAGPRRPVGLKGPQRIIPSTACFQILVFLFLFSAGPRRPAGLKGRHRILPSTACFQTVFSSSLFSLLLYRYQLPGVRVAGFVGCGGTVLFGSVGRLMQVTPFATRLGLPSASS